MSTTAELAQPLGLCCGTRYTLASVRDYLGPDGECARGFGSHDTYVCTKEYLAKVLRSLWQLQRDRGFQPYVAIHRKNATDNTIYEGCKVIGWMGGVNGEHVSCSQMELGNKNFNVDDVVDIQIGY